MLGELKPKGPRAICTAGLILEILCCDPKGHRALLRVPSTEGRGVRLCWALSKPKGAEGLSSIRSDAGLCCGSRLRKGKVFAYAGLVDYLKDLKVCPRSEMTQGFAAGPVYGRARCSPMLGSFIT